MRKNLSAPAAVLLLLVIGFNALADDQTATPSPAVMTPPRVPAFSVNYMDRSVDPSTNFYLFADGQWLKDNPVPPDKSRWASFTELAERNWFLIHEILNAAARSQVALPPHSPRREVGDFFASVMDTNRIEHLGLKPLAGDLKQIDRIQSAKDLFALLADFHQRGIGGIFDAALDRTKKTVPSMPSN